MIISPHIKRLKYAAYLTCTLVLTACGGDSDDDTPAPPETQPFVTREGQKLMLDGEEFRFQGSNNYYMHYQSNAMIDSVLEDAVEMEVTVLRIWGFLDGDNGHNVDMQPELGVYTPREGMGDGWERLDYTVKKASELGIKLVVAFTNNWADFGGIPRYVEWLGLGHHDDFYTDERAKEAYKNYVTHLLNRVNTYTNIAYKDDPTIMAWELANEPRAETDKTGRTLLSWADEMSTHVKSIDSKHLVTLGSEGFFKRDHENWAYNGHSGVDWEANLALANIDYGTIHLYPEHWGLEDQVETWGRQWIIDHIEAAKVIGKPAVLEEYGTLASGTEVREFIYESWTNAVYDHGGSGSMFWILSGIDDGENADEEGLYPDYDGFRIINDDSPASEILRVHGAMMTGGRDERENKVYIAHPISGADVEEVTTVKVFPMAYEGEVSLITLTTSSGIEVAMTGPDEAGYYSYDWDTTTEEEDSNVTLSVSAIINDMEHTHSAITTIENQITWTEGTTFSFSEDTEGWEQNGEWQATWGEPSVEHHEAGMLQINGSYPGEADWEELRIVGPEVTDLGQAQRLTYDIYYPINAYDPESAKGQQIRPYAILDPNWVKLGTDSITGSLNNYEIIMIDGEEYYHVPFEVHWDTLEDKTTLYIGIVNNYLPYSGPIFIDNVKVYTRG